MEIIKKAIEFHKKGDYKQAEEYYKIYLSRNPKEAKAHHLLGAMYMQEGELENALPSLQTAFSLENSTPIETDLALCFYKLEDFKNAFEHLKNVINDAENKTLYDAVIVCTKKLDLADECLEYSIKSLKLFGEDIYKLREIGDLAFDFEKYDIAREYFKKIIEICPADFVAYNNLGLAYEYAGDFDSAEAAYRKAIELKPNLDSYYNLSIILKRKRKYKESLDALLETKKFNSENFGKFNHALGLIHMIQKDFSGYPTYMEYIRKKYKDDMELWWTGGYDKNATLVICATEGYGDIIMFTRYLDFIDTSAFKEVVVIVPENLLELYTYNFPNFKFIKIGEGNGMAYNAGTILMELPLIYNLDFDHIPSTDKYLLAPPEYTEKWQKKLAKKGETKANVGIFFAGNTDDKRTLRNRKVPFEKLLPLLENKDIKFYSLQPENKFKEELSGHNIVDLSDEIKDFSDTAAIIDEIDIVISVDSSVVHLAGALGKKTYLMLPYSADWRWFELDKKCLWYDSVEIFKQQKEGDWTPVIQEIKTKLEKELN